MMVGFRGRATRAEPAQHPFALSLSKGTEPQAVRSRIAALRQAQGERVSLFGPNNNYASASFKSAVAADRSAD
jgi:hypothetical protein